MGKALTAGLALAFLAFSGPALAAAEASSVMSPKCDADRLGELAGDALISIEAGTAENIWVITLDTDKMTFEALLQEMISAGCF